MTALKTQMKIHRETDFAAGIDAQLAEQAIGPAAQPSPALDEYYSEAGPDYASWSHAYNMHFGYYRWGMNPLLREPMLEQMNIEILDRLRVPDNAPARLLDMGCGLGATLRSLAARLPHASLTGITIVPWQIERAGQLNRTAPGRERIHLVHADYERSELPGASFDAVYALESSCHAHGRDKALFLAEAHRLLRPGGRLVVADGFLRGDLPLIGPQRCLYRRLCECWVIETLAQLDQFLDSLTRLGFTEIQVERAQFRVAPSIFHIPFVTAKFLLSDVVFGKRGMTRARWNNILAPILLPLLSAPLGPMEYMIVSATKDPQ
jgi:MPBQ/MSBQ methyltransferase